MDIQQIFYITATAVFAIVGLVAIFIGYQVYRVSRLIKTYKQTAERLVSLADAARLTTKASILRTIVNLFGGRGGDKDE